METWASYRLQDFLLFCERVYRRLFEVHNEAWWPLPFVMLVLGLATAALWFFRFDRRTVHLRRASWVALVLVWVFVAIAFLRFRYAPISPIAMVGSWAFLSEAALIAAFGTTHGKTGSSGSIRIALGGVLVATGMIVYPLLGTFGTGSLIAGEWFGMAPDPTAIATLGILTIGIRHRLVLAVLLIIPVVWLVLSGLTLQIFGDPVAWVLFASVGLGLSALAVPARRQVLPG